DHVRRPVRRPQPLLAGPRGGGQHCTRRQEHEDFPHQPQRTVARPANETANRENRARQRRRGQPSGFFTGATGVTVYRGNAWPEEYRGNLFVGEVSGNLVYRARLEPKGVGFTATRADPDAEFLASTDNWFRPVQFANAPDGTLYMIDMYRELIEGAAFLPPQILKHMDVSAGVERGRIYRIVPDGFKQPKPPRLGKAT